MEQGSQRQRLTGVEGADQRCIHFESASFFVEVVAIQLG